MISKNNIITLTKNQIKSAGEVLGRALKDDPVSVHVLPDKNERHERIKYVFQMTSCLGIKYGEVHASSPNLEGVAVWIPFEKYKEKVWGNIVCALKAKMYKVGMQASKLIKPIREYNKKAHLQFAPNEHWYLQTLGVDPPHQGHGIGSILMEYMLENIDKNPLPVFLETSTEINVKFYERFGFSVMEEVIIPETNVKQWYLLRDVFS